MTEELFLFRVNRKLIRTQMLLPELELDLVLLLLEGGALRAPLAGSPAFVCTFVVFLFVVSTM